MSPLVGFGPEPVPCLVQILEAAFISSFWKQMVIPALVFLSLFTSPSLPLAKDLFIGSIDDLLSQVSAMLQAYFCFVREHMAGSRDKNVGLFGNIYLERHHDFVSEYD